MNKLQLISMLFLLISCKGSQDQKQGVNIIEYRRANFHGKLYNDVFGIGIERHFQKAGKTIKIEYLTKDGHSAYLKETDYPYYPHEYRFEYNDSGQLLSQTAYDSVGNIIDVDAYSTPAITKYKYDADGQLTEVSRFNKSNEPVGIGDSYEYMDTYGYNENGRISWNKSYSVDGKTILTDLSYTYNENGDLASQTYHKKDDSISQRIVYLGFNSDNEPLEVEYYDAKGLMFLKIWFEYEQGNSVTETALHHTWEEKQVTKMVLDFEIGGWKTAPINSVPPTFENYGSGEFNITVNDQGRIIDAKEIDKLKGNQKFKQEIFQYLRGITLEKNGNEVKKQGIFTIEVLEKFPVKNTKDFK